MCNCGGHGTSQDGEAAATKVEQQRKESRVRGTELNYGRCVDFSASLKEMCNERFSESFMVGAQGHPQRHAVAIGITYPWQRQGRESERD